jgi:hypothetical protein
MDHRSASDQLAKAVAGLTSSGPRRESSALADSTPADRDPPTPQELAVLNEAIAAITVPDAVLPLKAQIDPGGDGRPASVVLVCQASPELRLPLRELPPAAREPSPAPDQLTRETLSLATEWPAPSDQSWAPAPAADGAALARDSHVAQVLTRDGTVALVGASASGKTYTALHASAHLESFGWTVSLTDIGNPACGLDLLILQLMTTPRGHARRHLFVVDNIQGNPGLGRACLDLIARLAPCLGGSPACLGLTWPSGLPIVRLTYPDARVIQCLGDDVLVTLSQGIAGSAGASVVDEIRELSGGDALIARLAIEHFHKNGRLPRAAELADAAFHEITGGEPLSDSAVALLYELAVLGQFEVDVAASYAGRTDPQALTELITLGAARTNGPFVTIGHRTLAALVAAHAGAQVGAVSGPVQIVVDYLKAAGEAQLVATLERLDLVKLGSSGRDQHGSAFLASAWQSARVLTRYVAHQTRADPTWGDNVASAIFASEPLARFDVAAWALIADFVRTRWTFSHEELPVPVGETTGERIDFDEIMKRMADEDARDPSRACLLPAAAVDLDRTHRTWVLGLLLGFEAAAPVFQPDRVAALVACATTVQDAEGWFYPPRIPWVTARVLLGLAAAGESVDTSPTVQAACDWLRTPYPAGPVRFGVWDSGTGTWNTPAVTSAMCLLALVKCGVPHSDPTVRAARSYLLAKRDAWLAAGRELDAAEALQVLLVSGDHWRSVRDDLVRLLHWARDREAWSTALNSAAEVQDESSKVPSIAGSLVRLIWAILNTDISLLMEGVATEMSNRLLVSATT